MAPLWDQSLGFFRLEYSKWRQRHLQSPMWSCVGADKIKCLESPTWKTRDASRWGKKSMNPDKAHWLAKLTFRWLAASGKRFLKVSGGLRADSKIKSCTAHILICWSNLVGIILNSWAVENTTMKALKISFASGNCFTSHCLSIDSTQQKRSNKHLTTERIRTLRLVKKTSNTTSQGTNMWSYILVRLSNVIYYHG